MRVPRRRSSGPCYRPARRGSGGPADHPVAMATTELSGHPRPPHRAGAGHPGPGARSGRAGGGGLGRGWERRSRRRAAGAAGVGGPAPRPADRQDRRASEPPIGRRRRPPGPRSSCTRRAPTDWLWTPAVVVLLLAVAGALLTVLWPFYPRLLPVAPFGAILGLSAPGSWSSPGSRTGAPRSSWRWWPVHAEALLRRPRRAGNVWR